MNSSGVNRVIALDQQSAFLENLQPPQTRRSGNFSGRADTTYRDSLLLEFSQVELQEQVPRRVRKHDAAKIFSAVAASALNFANDPGAGFQIGTRQRVE